MKEKSKWIWKRWSANFEEENPFTDDPKWIYTINKSLPHNLVMHNSNFVFPKTSALAYLDIFPFFNFANHSQHGVDIEKYIQAWPEEEREKVRQENQARMGRLREALKEAAENGGVEFGKEHEE